MPVIEPVPLERQFLRAQTSMVEAAETILNLATGIVDHPGYVPQRDVSRLIAMANALGQRHAHWLRVRHELSEERKARHELRR